MEEFGGDSEEERELVMQKGANERQWEAQQGEVRAGQHAWHTKESQMEWKREHDDPLGKPILPEEAIQQPPGSPGLSVSASRVRLRRQRPPGCQTR
jgi:hypothetical protein